MYMKLNKKRVAMYSNVAFPNAYHIQTDLQRTLDMAEFQPMSPATRICEDNKVNGLQNNEVILNPSLEIEEDISTFRNSILNNCMSPVKFPHLSQHQASKDLNNNQIKDYNLHLTGAFQLKSYKTSDLKNSKSKKRYKIGTKLADKLNVQSSCINTIFNTNIKVEKMNNSHIWPILSDLFSNKKSELFMDEETMRKQEIQNGLLHGYNDIAMQMISDQEWYFRDILRSCSGPIVFDKLNS